MVAPAAVLFDQLAADAKPRPGNGAGCTEPHSCIVKIFRFAQEPKRITGGYPVCTVILGIAIAGERLVAAVEIDVHFLEEVFIDKVVGIEYNVSIAIVLFGEKDLEQIIKRISFADKICIVALDNAGSE